MIRALARTGAALAALVLLPALALAQASITGVVKDTSGAVLPGVTVEAASPAIIEKVRTAVTDGAGQYRITELRPGAYTVTFSLPGFNTVRRDGINLTGAFTASVDADLRVGALEETITVTGEAPIVDVQNATRQRVMDADVITALPTGRNMFELGVLIPGASLTGGLANQNVGGALGPETRSLVVHGGRQDEQRFMMNGVSLSSMIGGGWGGGAIPNATGVQEMVFDTAAVDASLATGGVRINFIAREGGNQFHGSFFGNYADSSFQGSNVDADLLSRNPRLANAGGVDKNWDFNPGIGGPIKKDKLWFFASGRSQGAYLFAAGMFYNQNANDPTRFDYVADTSRPASLEKKWTDYQLRLSWQATPKNKIGVTYQQQIFCACHDGINATTAPEAATDRRFPVQRPVLLDWTSPLTNKILLEASGIHRVERWGNMHLQTKGLEGNPNIVGIQEQGGAIPNLQYRNRIGTYNNSWNNNFHWRFNASYITGSHALKVGANDAIGYHDNETYVLNPVQYRFLNGIPNQITQRALPFTAKVRVYHDFGMFVQDKWTVNRFTISAGLRYDNFIQGFPEQELTPSVFAPNLTGSIPKTDNLNYRDITPKFQMAWDVFGTGKTAIKVTLNKYLQGLGTTGPLTGTPNPMNNLQRVVTRAWTDANNNKVPDCNLGILTLQDNRASGGDWCDVVNDLRFGSNIPSTAYDPDLMRGWGRRNFNWEYSTGIQHEILPRVSLDVSYFRRWYGNFLVTDNRAVTAADYTAFSVTAPSDPRLPGGGGYAVPGHQNLVPAKNGLIDNIVTRAQNFGQQYEHWNGVDVTANARLGNGVFLSGGTNTGRTSTDNCDIVDDVPESVLSVAANAPNLPFCHVDTNWLTQVKGSASYTVPRIAVQLSGTYQFLPGPELQANWAVNNAVVQGSLGRPLTGGVQTVNILQPGSVYGESLHQLDLRFSKILRFGTTKTMLNFDLYNATNSSTILTYNNGFVPLAGGGANWLQPNSILQARFFKIGAQFDF